MAIVVHECFLCREVPSVCNHIEAGDLLSDGGMPLRGLPIYIIQWVRQEVEIVAVDDMCMVTTSNQFSISASLRNFATLTSPQPHNRRIKAPRAKHKEFEVLINFPSPELRT